MVKLPENFIKKMSDIFAERKQEAEFASFIAGINSGAKPGFRINSNKVNIDEFMEKLQKKYGLSDLQPVPWTDDGFYVPDNFKISNLVEYLQGCFYIQEASAMLPAAILQVEAGSKVLDLCAAPGGKSTKLANDMAGDGLLVCNELNNDRARILLRNLEQWGATNTVLTTIDGSKFPSTFNKFFDKILVDAPCSGEGMFGRDPQAVIAWENYQGEELQNLQLKILLAAAKMLKPGGEILYSTCTFNPDENEGVIAKFLAENSEFSLSDVKERIKNSRNFLSDGLIINDNQNLQRCVRIWPHLTAGEGHFCALLKRKANDDFVDAEQEASAMAVPKIYPKTLRKNSPQQKNNLDRDLALNLFTNFCQNNFTDKGKDRYLKSGDERIFVERNFIHFLPVDKNIFVNIHVLKRGILLGEVKTGRKNKFIPSHALAMALSPDEYSYILTLGEDDDRIYSYIAGQSLALTEEESRNFPDNTYILLVYDRNPLGFAYKTTGSILKNNYPAAWIRQLQPIRN